MIATPAPPDRAAVRIFPPAVPLLAVAGGYILERVVPGAPAISLPIPLRWFGGALVVASILLLGAWSVALVRRSGQSENPWKPTTRVIQSGPFSITRNPMYLQMVLVTLGFGLALSNLGILVLTPVCAVVLQQLAILPEERYLERKFGDEYREYRQRVRRWL